MEENAHLRSIGQRPAEPERATNVHLAQRIPSLFAAARGPNATVDGDSPAEDKVRLFRSLFEGRDDVYAQRWENPRTKKSGWSPVTLDGHRSPARRYVPMDDDVVRSHLSGRITAGVYPLVDGDRCLFLACDFDKASWARRPGTPGSVRRCRCSRVPGAVTLRKRSARLDLLRRTRRGRRRPPARHGTAPRDDEPPRRSRPR